jgi:hypothetical protein
MTSDPAPLVTKPWHQLPEEKPASYEAFCEYLAMGTDRSLAKLAKSCGNITVSLRRLEQLSSVHDWVARAKAYDSDHLLERMSQRAEDREGTRQLAYDHAPRLLQMVIDIAHGHMPRGDVEIICDRNGEPKRTTVLGDYGVPMEVSMTKPAVSPRVRLAACQFALGVAGILEAKRLEVSGQEGDDVRLALRGLVSRLDPDLKTQLVKLLAIRQRSDGDA